MLRMIKVLLVLTVAVFGVVGAFGNVIDWEGTRGAVQATTTMSTWPGGETDWRATGNAFVVTTGAVLIPLLKLSFAALCAMGAWSMWRERGSEGPGFDRAKTLALAGCGLAVWMLFAGWIVVAETWFELWRSDALRGPALESAFRYAGFIGLIALFVAGRDDPGASTRP